MHTTKSILSIGSRIALIFILVISSITIPAHATASDEVNISLALTVLDIDTPAPGTTGPGEIFPITVTYLNGSDDTYTDVVGVVTILEYLSGAEPAPTVENNDIGSPGGVGARVSADVGDGILEPGETFSITFDVLLPSIELFEAESEVLAVLVPDEEESNEEQDITFDLTLLSIDNPPTGVTPPGGIFPITLTLRNDTDEVYTDIVAEVTLLEYLSGAEPAPTVENRDDGSSPSVGARVTVDLEDGELEPGETFSVTFDVKVPLIERFIANAKILSNSETSPPGGPIGN